MMIVAATSANRHVTPLNPTKENPVASFKIVQLDELPAAAAGRGKREHTKALDKQLRGAIDAMQDANAPAIQFDADPQITNWVKSRHETDADKLLTKVNTLVNTRLGKNKTDGTDWKDLVTRIVEAEFVPVNEEPDAHLIVKPGTSVVITLVSRNAEATSDQDADFDDEDSAYDED